jgi:hypothetical protein
MYNTRWPLVVFLFIWFFLIYSEIPFTIGAGKFIPSLGLVILLPIGWYAVYKNLTLNNLLFIIAGLAIAVFTLLVKFNVLLLQASVVKLAQLVYSLFICVVTFSFCKEAGSVILKKSCTAFLLFLSLGTLLERLGVISALTLKYRGLYANTDYGAEIDTGREVLVAGFVRPYMFTSEPSFVGLGFFVFSVGMVWLSDKKWIDWLCLIGVFIMLQLLGSPTVLFAVFVWAAIYSVKYQVPLKNISLIGAGVGVVFFAAYQFGLLGAVSEIIVKRIAQEIVDESSSIYYRIVVPYAKTLPAVMQNYPLWGVGFGNYGYINLLFGYPLNYYEQDSVSILGANGFATLVCYYGILGTILLFLNIFYLQYSNQIKYAGITVLFVICLAQISGGISTPRFWGYIGLFIACTQVFTTSQVSKVASNNA